jgi:hypothetical protein
MSAVAPPLSRTPLLARRLRQREMALLAGSIVLGKGGPSGHSVRRRLFADIIPCSPASRPLPDGMNETSSAPAAAVPESDTGDGAGEGGPRPAHQPACLVRW